MKKISVLVLLITLLIPSLLFAAGDQETQKTVINFPTAATTGAVYPLGSAMSNLW
ncbi:MAG: C4-dicarboxylate ABC transporter substrate-binding protein, partial [Chloroflexia bacterium]|nr:C4-dicarboxylate ABC transporter substrate-binding protein [Chloroflexia bacterium]